MVCGIAPPGSNLCYRRVERLERNSLWQEETEEGGKMDGREDTVSSVPVNHIHHIHFAAVVGSPSFGHCVIPTYDQTLSHHLVPHSDNPEVTDTLSKVSLW